MAEKRSLTTAMENELGKANVRPAFKIELDFPSGLQRYWTRRTNISSLARTSTGGETTATFTGDGTILGIGEMEEAVGLKRTDVNLILSAESSALRTAIEDDDYQGRPGRVWFSLLDSTGGEISDPFIKFAGRIDSVVWDDNPRRPIFNVTVASHITDLGRSRVRRYTDEDQKSEFSTDDGLRFVELLVERPIEPTEIG